MTTTRFWFFYSSELFAVTINKKEHKKFLFEQKREGRRKNFFHIQSMKKCHGLRISIYYFSKKSLIAPQNFPLYKGNLAGEQTVPEIF